MKKRGSLTIWKIASFIMLLIGFAIVLFFIFRLDIGKTTEKQICHNSVVMKSRSDGFVGALNCKTNYLCISGGGKCEMINPTSTVKVDSNNREEIMKAIADEMADCWWMFSEYYSPNVEIVFGNLNCAICSIVRFDEKILEKEYIIGYREFLEYLARTNKDESQTYFTYLYNSPNLDEFINRGGVLNTELENSNILDDDEYAILTGRRGRKSAIYPTYLKSSQISFFECKDFVTEA